MPVQVFQLRGMLAVPYFEKRLYEMDESALSTEAVLALADEVEEQIQGGLSPRPLMSVPHILADEASCYCESWRCWSGCTECGVRVYKGYALSSSVPHIASEQGKV